MDKDKGGYFSIAPTPGVSCTTKQQYLPGTNILQTRYINEDGVVDVVDFFPRPRNSNVVSKGPKQTAFREVTKVQEELKRWLVRRVECIRGQLELGEDIVAFARYERFAHAHHQLSRSSRRLATPKILM